MRRRGVRGEKQRRESCGGGQADIAAWRFLRDLPCQSRRQRSISRHKLRAWSSTACDANMLAGPVLVCVVGKWMAGETR